MKKKLCMLLFCVCLPLGVAGCKSTDYKNAIELEEAKDYSQEAIIYTERDEYKDSKGHLEYCYAMIDLTERYNVAKSMAEKKNEELDNAISVTESLILEKATALETAVSEAKAEKQSIPQIPETRNEINSVCDEFINIDYSEVLANLSDKKYSLEQSIKQYSLVNAPAEAYIIKCLKKVPNVIGISAITEDNDPNGHLNKAGGYTAQVFFQVI